MCKCGGYLKKEYYGHWKCTRCGKDMYSYIIIIKKD